MEPKVVEREENVASSNQEVGQPPYVGDLGVKVLLQGEGLN